MREAVVGNLPTRTNNQVQQVYDSSLTDKQNSPRCGWGPVSLPTRVLVNGAGRLLNFILRAAMPLQSKRLRLGRNTGP